MKAMTIEQFGDESVFAQDDIETPEIKSGHVKIRVSASSVNPVDTMIRSMGNDLPFAPSLPAVLGMDVAGVITEVADDVTSFQVGDKVFGCVGGLGELQGTLAEYVVADARLIALMPRKLTMKQAAVLPLVSITAYEGLTRAGVTQGQKVLVHGGSGGVGHIAVQLAKAMGADVYATGGGEPQLTLIKDLGATPINYKTESVQDYVEKHTMGKGFDVVFDSVGAENLVNSFNAAKLNGQIAATVSLANIDLSMLHMRGLSLHLVFMLLPMMYNEGREQHHKILQTISQLVDSNQLLPVLDTEDFEFSNIGDAHRRLASGKAMGKVAVTGF